MRRQWLQAHSPRTAEPKWSVYEVKVPAIPHQGPNRGCRGFKWLVHYLLSLKKKDAFPQLTKKCFPRHLRFKNHLKFLQTIKQPQEWTFAFAAIFVYLYYRAARRLDNRNRSTNQTKVPFVVMHSEQCNLPDWGGCTATKSGPIIFCSKANPSHVDAVSQQAAFFLVFLPYKPLTLNQANLFSPGLSYPWAWRHSLFTSCHYHYQHKGCLLCPIPRFLCSQSLLLCFFVVGGLPRISSKENR